MEDRGLIKIVKKAAKGNEEAFLQLYNFFIKNVYYMALKTTGNQQDAEDVVQETMFKLYNNIGSIKDPKAIKRFVYTITYNSSMDIIRKRENIVPVEDEIIGNIPDIDEEFLPIEYVENEELHKELLDKVDLLSRDKKLVIILRYYQQLNIKDISKILNISETKVKNRLYRARIDLENLLKDKSLKKGGIVTLIAFTVLSRVLTYDSEASFDEDIYKNNLAKFIQRTNISIDPSKISLDSFSNASSMALVNSSAESALSLTSSKIAIGLAALIITASSGAYIYTKVNSNNKTPKFNPLNNYSSVDNNGTTISNSSQPTIAPNSIEPVAPIQANPPPETISKNDINEPSVTQHNKVDTGSSKIYPENNTPQIVLKDKEGLLADVDNKQSTSANLTNYQLHANNYILKYPINSKVSVDDIIKDADLEYSKELTIEAHEFEKIDFSKKNQYGIILSGSINGKPQVSNIGIIVIVDDNKNYSFEEGVNEK